MPLPHSGVTAVSPSVSAAVVVVPSVVPLGLPHAHARRRRRRRRRRGPRCPSCWASGVGLLVVGVRLEASPSVWLTAPGDVVDTVAAGDQRGGTEAGGEAVVRMGVFMVMGPRVQGIAARPRTRARTWRSRPSAFPISPRADQPCKSATRVVRNRQQISPRENARTRAAPHPPGATRASCHISGVFLIMGGTILGHHRARIVPRTNPQTPPNTRAQNTK